jgi:hypothetical protein
VTAATEAVTCGWHDIIADMASVHDQYRLLCCSCDSTHADFLHLKHISILIAILYVLLSMLCCEPTAACAPSFLCGVIIGGMSYAIDSTAAMLKSNTNAGLLPSNS